MINERKEDMPTIIANIITLCQTMKQKRQGRNKWEIIKMKWNDKSIYYYMW